MKVSTIKSTWLPKGGFRLDCSPYLGGAIETEILLEELPVRKDSLGSVTKAIYHAGRESRQWVDDPEFGVRFLGAGQLQRADFSELPLISRSQVASTPAFIVRKSWTLITRSGTIGKMAYCRPEMDGLAVSEDVLRVVPDEQQIPPGYLYAFLSSKFGVPLITSGTYGAIIQHLEPSHINSLSVPRFGDAVEYEIHQLVEEAARLRSEANRLREEASVDLIGLSCMKPLQNKDQSKSSAYCVVFNTNLGSRLDTNYHSALHYAAVERIRDSKFGGITVGELAASVVEMPRFKRIPLYNSVEAQNLYGTGDIGNVDPQPISRIAAFPGSMEYAAKPNSVLIPRSGQLNGIIGSAILPIGGLREGIVSEHAIRVNAATEEIAGYLYLALNLKEGRVQLKARAFGGSIPTLDVHNVSKVLVPNIGASEMTRLGRLGFNVSELRTTAIVLERRARELVESQILQRHK